MASSGLDTYPFVCDNRGMSNQHIITIECPSPAVVKQILAEAQRLEEAFGASESSTIKGMRDLASHVMDAASNPRTLVMIRGQVTPVIVTGEGELDGQPCVNYTSADGAHLYTSTKEQFEASQRLVMA